MKNISNLLTHLSRQVQSAEKYTFDRRDAWGYLCSIDITDCDPAKVRAQDSILTYNRDLCKLIKCHPYGEPTIARIGDGPQLFGWSYTQLVTTSSITGHFIESNNSAYIDIFFCRYFDPDEAVKFTVDYFNAKNVIVHTLTRGKVNA
jgi:S-adenosylmethionine/arginine decarboxylase-like enzyme